jgi:hypothetical protein
LNGNSTLGHINKRADLIKETEILGVENETLIPTTNT